MNTQPYFCNTRHHPDLQASYDAALKENPANAAITPSYLTDEQQATDVQSRIVTSFTKYWARGRTLRIRFLGPIPPFLQQIFFDTACKWLPHVNLKFVLVEAGDAEIRIELNSKLHLSAVGTDALLGFHDQRIATMYFDLTRLIDTDKLIAMQGRAFDKFNFIQYLSADFERTVLHEFGHALGAEHEHQHPDARIPWDEQAVLKDFAVEGVTPEFVRRNIMDKYEAADFSYSAYDPESVMHYDVQQRHTLGDFQIDNSGKGLSIKDKEFMSFIYGDRQNDRGPLD